MKCDEYKESISAYLDNELDTEEEKDFLKHLKECEKCSLYYAKAKQADERIEMADVPEIEKPIIDYKKKRPMFKLAIAGSSVVSVLLVLVIAVSIISRPLSNTNKTSSKDSGLPPANLEELYGGRSGLKYMKGPENQAEGEKKEPKSKKTTKPMVIRNKDLSLEVVDVNKAYGEIDKLVSRSDGYVESTNFSRDSNGAAYYGYIKVKIPNDVFEKTLAEIRKTGLVKSMNENSQDVTLEYVDNKARLRNLRLQEKRYLALLDRANSIDEILAVEGQVSSVREQIEQLTGRINYLKNAASYVTLSITLNKKASTVSWGFFDEIKQAVQNALDVTGFLVRAIGALLPLILLGMALVYGIKRIKRRK